jgi:hypothetical protein
MHLRLDKKSLEQAIYKVPMPYQVRQHHKYPIDNVHEFERWFRDNTTAEEFAGKNRTYLPVMWTAYLCNNGYGRKFTPKRLLQNFIDTLPRTRKYFSIVQYDDGPMVDFRNIDIKIFGMSGGRIDYPIPLLCQPHPYEFPNAKKDIFCSFIGADTHPIRRELVKEFKGKKDCIVEIKKTDMKKYCEILARSVFALAPRGYGKSSFRICEAMQYGATPVYISDEFVKPYNMDDLIYVSEVKGLYRKLKDMDTPELHERIRGYKELFTYQGCKKMIIQNI